MQVLTSYDPQMDASLLCGAHDLGFGHQSSFIVYSHKIIHI